MRTIVASVLILLALTSASEARHCAIKCSQGQPSAHSMAHYDARPRAWCGWWMRHQMPADPGPAYNLARKWLDYGTRLAGPMVGAIVVFPRACKNKNCGHVGLLRGKDARGMWLIESGNAGGGQVRVAPRSIANAIGFRLPPGSIPALPTFATAPPTPQTVTREHFT